MAKKKLVEDAKSKQIIEEEVDDSDSQPSCDNFELVEMDKFVKEAIILESKPVES